MQQNCKDILERFKDGDSYAYEKLYKLYRKDAFRFCNYILRDKNDSEDIIHDVFLKIWIKRSYVNPSLNFKSYLLAIIQQFRVKGSNYKLLSTGHRKSTHLYFDRW
jgi:DNA-directed RNA polymerase specialized sigma24 family protein